MSKRVRNLSTELSSWVQAVIGTDVATGIGDVYFLAKTASSTSQWLSWLQSNGVTESHICTTSTGLTDLHSAVTGYRNDTIIVMPGGYSQTAAVTWSKAYVNVIGAAPPIGYGGRCRITHGVNTATLFSITGASTRWKNIHWQWGNGSTTNKTCVSIGTTQTMLEDCIIEGIDATDMGGTQDFALLKIAAASQACTLRRVQIGNWAALAASANGSCLEFAGDNSDFLGEDVTLYPCNSSTSNIPIDAGVDLGGDYAFAQFKNLQVISHYWSDSNTYVSTNTKVFDPPTKGTIFLDNRCCMTGYSDWGTLDNTHIRVSGPAASDVGGMATYPTT
jgi:hypothetical protein